MDIDGVPEQINSNDGEDDLRPVSNRDGEGHMWAEKWKEEIDFLLDKRLIELEGSATIECAICKDAVINTTVVTCCLKRFCKKCIHQSLYSIPSCPMCRKKINILEDLKEDTKLIELGQLFRN